MKVKNTQFMRQLFFFFVWFLFYQNPANPQVFCLHQFFVKTRNIYPKERRFSYKGYHVEGVCCKTYDSVHTAGPNPALVSGAELDLTAFTEHNCEGRYIQVCSTLTLLLEWNTFTRKAAQNVTCTCIWMLEFWCWIWLYPTIWLSKPQSYATLEG